MELPHLVSAPDIKNTVLCHRTGRISARKYRLYLLQICDVKGIADRSLVRAKLTELVRAGSFNRAVSHKHNRVLVARLSLSRAAGNYLSQRRLILVITRSKLTVLIITAGINLSGLRNDKRKSVARRDVNSVVHQLSFSVLLRIDRESQLAVPVAAPAYN